MSKIVAEALSVVNGLSTSEDTQPTKINSQAAEIIGAVENKMQEFYANFSDWFELASQIPDAQNGTVAIGKTRYRVGQALNPLFSAVYGNRTKEELARGEKMELNSVRYCDKENADYRQSVVSSLDTPEAGAQNGLEIDEATAHVNALEGELRLRTWKPFFEAVLALYELTCEDTWQYRPWNEVPKARSNNAFSAAAEIMKRRGMTPAE